MAVYIFGKWLGRPNLEKLKAKGKIQWLIRTFSYNGYGRGSVSNEAIKALVELGPSAFNPLCSALKRGWRIQWGAIEALGKIGDARAVEPLMAIFRKHKYSSTHYDLRFGDF